MIKRAEAVVWVVGKGGNLHKKSCMVLEGEEEFGAVHIKRKRNKLHAVYTFGGWVSRHTAN